jgi:hypothetical protein
VVGWNAIWTKSDEITLALLWPTSFKNADGIRAWKGTTGKRWIEFTKRATLSDPQSEIGCLD